MRLIDGGFPPPFFSVGGNILKISWPSHGLTHFQSFTRVSGNIIKNGMCAFERKRTVYMCSFLEPGSPRRDTRGCQKAFLD